MKTSRILKLMGIALMGLLMAAQVEATDRTNRKTVKKAVTLMIDQPIIEFVSKVYADQLEADDVVRVQKMLGQIDYVTITFSDKDACDYVLKFKPLDKLGLEDWMFKEGFLNSCPETGTVAIESWMLDPDYLN